MNITVKYFAALAECAGKTWEQRELTHSSIEELYAQLQREYHFPHPFAKVRVAVNTSYVNADHPLKENDTVVFITPVAGG